MAAKEKLKRSEREIFLELESLCVSPGFIHAIAYICMRDNLIRYSGEMTTEDMGRLYGRERLLRNEVNALIGLLVKNDIDYSLPVETVLAQYVARSQSLLEEIHQTMLIPMRDSISRGSAHVDSVKLGGVLTSGAMMREAIFYGGESAYAFHYRDFAPLRYGQDDAWIVAHMGFSIKDAAAVVRAVGLLLNEKSTDVFHVLDESRPFAHTCLPGFEFSAAEAAAKSKLSLDIVERVLTAFAYPEQDRNGQFKAVDDRNIAAILPLIRRDDNYILFNIYDLSEVLYQAPFFWVWADEPYRPTAQANRGAFTEDFAEVRLASVFGRSNVKANVNLVRSKEVIGEIDVLVFFGDLAIALQAKSKQLTAAARKGNEAKLQDDFAAAVQKACNQGYAYGQLLLDSSVMLEDANGVIVSAPKAISKIYIICLIADHYPALSAQTRQFLKFDPVEKLAPPFVMDVFHLDAMSEMLDTPLQFLSYLDRRSNYHEKVIANHELNILGFHLSHNLWLQSGNSLMYLEDDVGASLELSMLVRRENVSGQWTPPGILTRMEGHRLGKVIREIERQPNPAMFALGFLILCMGEETFVSISAAVDELMRRASTDCKRHDVSVQLAGGQAGLTIHVNLDSQEEAEQRLSAHCAARKYAQRAESWFGLILDAHTGGIRFGLQVSGPWVHDLKMDELIKGMAKATPVKRLRLPQLTIRKKVGRNDPCPCGSGKKSKRCCYA
jgi:hypothetical protein